MKTASKMSCEDRRTAIIKTARTVFVEKGFDRTTYRGNGGPGSSPATDDPLLTT